MNGQNDLRVLLKRILTVEERIRSGRVRNPLLLEPPDLVDGDMWLEVAGEEPSRIAELKFKDHGVVRTLATLTF